MSDLLAATSLTTTLGGREVLSDVSLTLSPGEIVTLIGPNGCGKTTLLRALLGQAKSSGSITWMDRPLHKWSKRELAKQVAYLPQAPTFDPGDTVLETLRLGRAPHHGLMGLESDRDDQVVQQAAADLSLTDLLARPLATLSGGQRQRAFLGRALAQEPAVLLLDEPATFLDLLHQVELHQLLRKLSEEKKIGVILASHDLNLAATHADRAIVMKAGRVLASGTIADVMTGETLSTAFDLPVQRVEAGGRTAFVAG